MRGRTLAAAAAAYIIVSFLLLTIWPLPLYNDNTREGRETVVYGTVRAFNYRNEKLQIILDSVVFSDNTDSGKGQFNKGNGSRHGAVCYLDEDAEAPKIGAAVMVAGIFRNIKSATNPGEFDLKRYYQIKGIDFQMVKASVIKESRRYDWLGEYLAQSRLYFKAVLDRCFSREPAELLKAMLLGDKDALSDETKETFTKCGLSHLLVISGTHIGIIGLLIYGLFEKIGRNKYISATGSVVFMWYYGALTQMGTATLRAILMFAICMLAKIAGRTYDIITALAVSALVTLIANPLQIYDTGFLLSFCAVFAIAVLRELPVNLRVSVFSLPITMSSFYTFPTYSLILNIFLIPPLGFLIMTGLLSILFGCIAYKTVFMQLSVWLCEMLCKLYIFICGYFANMPFSTYVTGTPSVLLIFFYYAAILYLCPRLVKYLKRKLHHGALKQLAKLVYVVPVIMLLYQPRSDLSMIFSDVGQGDGIVIYTKNHCVLIDGGSSDKKNVGKNVMLPTLKKLKLTNVDMMFITHMDEDHISGAKQLIEFADNEGIHIEAIGMSENSMDDEKAVAIRETAKNKGIHIYEIQAGDEIDYGRLKLKCLYPFEGQKGDTNELSLTLRLEYGDFSAFLCGDLEGEGEKDMIETVKPQKVNVYKAAHHGSKGTGSEELLSLLSPDVTVISCGEKNKYGHPHKETLERLEKCKSKIYMTKDSGAVIIKTDGKIMKLEEFSDAND